MNTELQKLPPPALRNRLIMESKKFIWALDLGATVHDLEEIRQAIRDITEILKLKESGSEELSLQKNVQKPVNPSYLGQKGDGI